MFGSIKKILHFVSLGTILLKIKYNKRLTQKLSHDLVENIFKCGCVIIKFGQWYAMRYDVHHMGKQPICEILHKTLDDCPSHSYEYTKKTFVSDFGFQLEDKIKLDKNVPIASGSVGQVYKGKYQNREIMMKVMHPNLDCDYNVSSFILKIFGKYVFPYIDIKEFLNSVKMQFDYNNEASNMKTLYELYKNDELIVIPKLFFHSKHIIVMSYEEGMDYNEIKSDVIKQKIAMSLLSFQRQNASVYGCVHGDLHNGNWKIRMNQDSLTFKLVVYDYGLVNFVDPDMMKKWIKAYQLQDYYTMIKLLINENNINDDILNIIVDSIRDIINSPPNVMNVLKCLIPLLRKYNLKLKENILTILISFGLTEKALLNLQSYDYDLNNLNNIYLSNCLDIIAFCESKNTCNLLKEQLKDDIKNLKLTSMFTKDTDSKSGFDLNLDEFYQNISDYSDSDKDE